MSFVHVLSQIGRGALKIVPIAVSTINPPLGALVTAGAAVVTAEIEHGADNGPAKLEQAMAHVSASPILAASPVPQETRGQHIRELIEAVVSAFNALEKLFPPPA